MKSRGYCNPETLDLILASQVAFVNHDNRYSLRTPHGPSYTEFCRAVLITNTLTCMWRPTGKTIYPGAIVLCISIIVTAKS